jgi:hypothetical protein
VRRDETGRDFGDRPCEELAGRGEIGVAGRPLDRQVQLAGVRQREHVAVPHHHADHAVGGPLLGAAPGGGWLELIAAPGDRHGQSRGECRELDGLLGRLRVGQHRLGCGDSFLNPVLVHRYCRSDRVHDELEGRILQTLVQQLEDLVGPSHFAHRPEQNRQPGKAPQHELKLVELVWVEHCQNLFGLNRMALPQQRA